MRKTCKMSHWRRGNVKGLNRQIQPVTRQVMQKNKQQMQRAGTMRQRQCAGALGDLSALEHIDYF